MDGRRFERFAPLLGVLFLVLAVASFLIGGEPPKAEDPPLELSEYWSDEKGSQIASAILATYAAVVLVWFAGSVRDAIARVEPGASRLASIAFGGAVIYAVGILLSAAIQLAAAETAGDVSADVTQTFTAMFEHFWPPLAAGNALFLLAAGLAAIRYGAFDRWLGWIAIAIGLISLTPAGFVGFLAGVVWVAIAGVMLYRKTDPVGSGAQPPAAGSGGPKIEVPPGA